MSSDRPAALEAMVRRFKPYPEYKDSGVEWLGKIPAHWEVRRLKTLAEVQLSNVDKKSVEGEEPVRLCNYLDVYYNERITADLNFMPATATPDQIRRFSLRRGDVLITKDSESWTDIAVPAVVAEDLPGVLVGYHLAQIRPGPECDGAFLAYAFSAIGPRDQFNVSANGITRFGLSADAVRTGLLAVPPLEEQRRIVAFLQRVTARIAALVAKKQRLLELLQERRTVLIARAVTKGLDPNAPTKASGIKWLGEIPAHWAVRRLRYGVSKIGSGKTPSGGADVYVDDGVMLLRSQNVRELRLQLEDVVFIDAETESGMASSRVHEGDVLLNITGASLGRCCVANLDGAAANVNQHVCIIRPRRDVFDSEFLAAMIASPPMQAQIFSIENGISRDALNFAQVGGLMVVEPPLREQQRIAGAIAADNRRIDILIATVQQATNRLKEFRAALISAAVTGQIDVREEAV